MSVAPFHPKPMKLSVLTAALQELTPRERRDPDPDLAVEEWLDFARDIGAPYIQLSAALHPSEADVPAEALLDPVANTLDLRAPLDRSRADRILAAMRETGVGLSDLAYFDNMLIADESARRKKHAFMLRVFDAAVLLGTDAVCGFVGRNYDLEMDQNVAMFEEVFIPLLKEAKARGLTYRVEQCPMPGWTVLDRWHNNLAYAPGPMDRSAPDLREARRGRPVPHSLRPVACDSDGPGHALDLPVPEGRGLRLPDRRLPREGPGHRQPRGLGLGLRGADDAARRLAGFAAIRSSGRPGKRLEESRSCCASTNCRARRATIRSLICRIAPSTGSIISSRRANCLRSIPARPFSSSSTSIPRARVQDRAKLAPILKGSLAFTRAIDEAAAAMYALQHEVLASQGIPVQGVGRQAYRS